MTADHGAPTSERDLVQLLTPEGERLEHPVLLKISEEELRSLLVTRARTALRYRGDRTAEAGRAGHLGLAAPPRGCANRIGPSVAPRRHGVPDLPRTALPGAAASARELLQLFRGVNFGGWDPKEHNFALYTIVIGAQTLHATGYAMGMQRDGSEDAVIAYFGDGASSEATSTRRFSRRPTTPPSCSFCRTTVGNLGP